MRNYVNQNGIFQGSFIKEQSDENLIEVPTPPANIYQVWDSENQVWNGSKDDLFTRYANFRVSILNSTGWQLIRRINPPGIAEFVGAVAYMDDGQDTVKLLWNMLIPQMPIEPSHITEWQAIVTTLQLGLTWIRDRDLAFDFDDDGLML